MTPMFPRASHYTSVVRAPPGGDPQDPADKSDLARFVFNFLADALSAGPKPDPKPDPGRGACGGGRGACPPTQACVGWTASGPGHCVNATARYVPAYSPYLAFDAPPEGVGRWRVLGAGERAEPAEEPDPLWTDSFWQQDIGVRM